MGGLEGISAFLSLDSISYINKIHQSHFSVNKKEKNRKRQLFIYCFIIKFSFICQYKQTTSKLIFFLNIFPVSYGLENILSTFLYSHCDVFFVHAHINLDKRAKLKVINQNRLCNIELPILHLCCSQKKKNNNNKIK